MFYSEKFPVAQCLRLSTFTAGPGFSPGWGTEILQTPQHDPKKKPKKVCFFLIKNKTHAKEEKIQQ